MIRQVRIKRRDVPRSLPEGLHPVAARVLAARGLKQAPDYSLAGLLPPSLGGMDQACRLLHQAIVDNQSILVVGDFDADGATGTALAVRGLRAMGARRVGWLTPDRVRHGYGLGTQLVSEIPDPVPDLILTVDQGVSSVEGVALARQRGMRVIVTDHHLPSEQLPAADAIINPQLPGERFPSACLAGVGVMFYLLMGLRAHVRDQGGFAGKQPRLDAWLDLVALGTVADLVPLDENNRRLVHQGLMRIRAGRCSPGVRYLLEVAGRNLRHVTAADLGFAAAPRLNAAGRLDDMGIGVRCLLAESESEAHAIAGQLDALNRERQSIQAEMQELAEEQAEEQARRLAEQTRGQPNGLCVFDPDWHSGVVGLVAGRLMDRLQRPVVAFAPADATGGLLKGSARSPAGIHMRDLLVEIDTRQPGLIDRFGGHARAAGLSLSSANLESFRECFDNILESREFGEDVVWSDGALDGHWLTTETAEALDRAGPWGQTWPAPLFDDRFQVQERREVGSGHLKLRLKPLDGGASVDAIAFGAGRLCYQELPDPLHVAYALEVNRWKGQSRPQLRILYLVDRD